MAEKPKLLPQYFAALSANLGGFVIGTIIGWASPTTEEIRNLLAVSDQKVAWVGSIMPLGCATIMLPLPLLMKLFGRKTTMLIMAPINCASWILLAFSNTLLMFCLGRFLTGLSGGTFCVVAPVYVAEMSQASIRGTLSVLFQLMITIGILVSFILGNFLKVQQLCLVLSIFPIIMFVFMICLPESPLHLMMKGNKDGVAKSLKYFRGKNYDISNEMKELTDTVDAYREKQKESGFEKFKTRAAKKACCIIIFLHIIQQLSGINVILFYATKIFDMTGSSISGNICAIILGVVQVIATFISAALVDRVGRKIMMATSQAIMFICLILIGVYFTLSDINSDFEYSLALLPVISINIYLIGFSLGTGPLPWAMLGEMFPNEIKNIASPIAACLNWLMAFLVTKLFPLMVDILKPMGTFYLYASICLIGVLFSILYYMKLKEKRWKKYKMN